MVTIKRDTKKSGGVLWITRTAIFIAILLVVQFLTAQFGNTLITGSLVNMLLIISVMTCGIQSGVVVALLSPIFAFLIGIGPPFWPIIPIIMIGNTVLVVLWKKIGDGERHNRVAAWIVALVTAAIVKFGIVFFGVTKLVIPIILALPEPHATNISLAFSFPQLITACIGGVLAIAILPTLKKVIR